MSGTTNPETLPPLTEEPRSEVVTGIANPSTWIVVETGGVSSIEKTYRDTSGPAQLAVWGRSLQKENSQD